MPQSFSNHSIFSEATANTNLSCGLEDSACETFRFETFSRKCSRPVKRVARKENLETKKQSSEIHCTL